VGKSSTDQAVNSENSLRPSLASATPQIQESQSDTMASINGSTSDNVPRHDVATQFTNQHNYIQQSTPSVQNGPEVSCQSSYLGCPRGIALSQSFTEPISANSPIEDQQLFANDLFSYGFDEVTPSDIMPYGSNLVYSYNTDESCNKVPNYITHQSNRS
jgi:hypothetical protein